MDRRPAADGSRAFCRLFLCAGGLSARLQGAPCNTAGDQVLTSRPRAGLLLRPRVLYNDRILRPTLRGEHHSTLDCSGYSAPLTVSAILFAAFLPGRKCYTWGDSLPRPQVPTGPRGFLQGGGRPKPWCPLGSAATKDRVGTVPAGRERRNVNDLANPAGAFVRIVRRPALFCLLEDETAAATASVRPARTDSPWPH